jgi:hypothetical protein
MRTLLVGPRRAPPAGPREWTHRVDPFGAGQVDPGQAAGPDLRTSNREDRS